MAYLSLYRRWRSQSFADVVGQKHIVRTLKNSLDTGRISHAYLFTGPRGTGKTTLARLYAKGLNCTNGPTSNFCGECDGCTEITNGNSLNVIEIDGASNRGIEEIRELREQVKYVPTDGHYKIFIIDEVHMLTTEAFNALLKTLEEPPERVVFILATTDPQKIPATIISRCQRYDFRRFTIEQIMDHLQKVLSKENVQAEQRALEAVAEHADGGMRDALGIIDQCLAYSDNLSEDIVTEVLGVATRARIEQFLVELDQKDGSKLFNFINQLYIDGKNLGQFVRDLLRVLRKGVLNHEDFNRIGINWSSDYLLKIMEVFAQCERDMRYINDTNIPLELAVLRVIDLGSSKTISREMLDETQVKLDQLSTKIAKLEKTGLVARTTDNNVNQQQSSAEKQKVRLNSNGDDLKKLALIKDNWSDFLEMLHSERLVQPEAFLREGSPVGVEDDKLIIAFSQGRGFHKASIEQPKHREPAERAFAKMFGSQLTFHCITADDKEFKVQGGNKRKKEAEPERQLESNKLNQTEYDDSVNAALKMFGGKVINIKNDEKGGTGK